METTNDIVQRFSEVLKSGEGHLNEPVLSLYINFHNALSEGEKVFVDKHLQQCVECSKLYERVFDDEIDLDSGHVHLVLEKAMPDGTADAVTFNDPKQTFVMQAQKEANGFSIAFTKLPKEYELQKMRISLASICLRISSVQENKQIPLSGNVLTREHFNSVTITVVPQATAEAKNNLVPLFIRYTRYLAAAVLIVVAGGILYENLNQPEDKMTAVEPKIETTIDSLDHKKKPDLPENKKEPVLKKIPEIVLTPVLADNYKPNDVLETFVDRHYRTATAEIISPGNGDTLSSPIVFKWKEMEGVRSFTVVIVNNKNDEIWRGTAQGFSVTYDEKLKPGLYYWMLKSDGDMLSVRKFFVR